MSNNVIMDYILFNTNIYNWKTYFPGILLTIIQEGGDFNKSDYIMCKEKIFDYTSVKLRADLQNNRRNRKTIYPKNVVIFDHIMTLMNLKYKQIDSLDLPYDVLGIIKDYLDL